MSTAYLENPFAVAHQNPETDTTISEASITTCQVPGMEKYLEGKSNRRLMEFLIDNEIKGQKAMQLYSLLTQMRRQTETGKPKVIVKYMTLFD